MKEYVCIYIYIYIYVYVHNFIYNITLYHNSHFFFDAAASIVARGRPRKLHQGIISRLDSHQPHSYLDGRVRGA